MTERIFRYLREQQPETPCLVVDLDVVENNFRRMRELLPAAHIFYAVKANPAAQILSRLATAGSEPGRRDRRPPAPGWAPSFDVASRGEIELCLGRGVAADRLSFGNTIKKEKDIAYAYQRGVRLFAFDSEAELEKLAASAPGARVFCRILVDCAGAEWPLSRKFGCAPEMAVDLLRRPSSWGLDPYGVSFHVGSQQTDLEQWDSAVGRAAQMFSRSPRPTSICAWSISAAASRRTIAARCRASSNMPRRSRRAGDPPFRQRPARDHHRARPLAGRRRRRDPERGRADLAQGGRRPQALGLSRCRQVQRVWPRPWTRASSTASARRATARASGPVVLAGPTCDSADILYEKTEYRLPLALKVGDKVEIYPSCQVLSKVLIFRILDDIFARTSNQPAPNSS